ncbi:hypothetical protein K470DRAFT_260260 [Piedraia hortae CBS 480.64]|uniref:HMG box domain-containing protein n=1 Tax=Piedraia hortae CBS 480.64 TaxID=1314780 RepID=A0A6A7BTB7_9PEZI|nr:hypothetical protein K470DRAFT_260260 [Piedraia hortae CBS 480.64]
MSGFRAIVHASLPGHRLLLPLATVLRAGYSFQPHQLGRFYATVRKKAVAKTETDSAAPGKPATKTKDEAKTKMKKTTKKSDGQSRKKRTTNKKSATGAKPKKRRVKTKNSGTRKNKGIGSRMSPERLAEYKAQRKGIELKKLALSPPTRPYSFNSYTMFIKENFQKLQAGLADSEPKSKVFSKLAEQWNSLSSAEAGEYETSAATHRDKLASEYQAWVHKHTPEEIAKANNARMALRRRAAKSHAKRFGKWPRIIDDRHVKKPATGYALFVKDRFASGDFKDTSFKDASQQIAKEYQALDQAAKDALKKRVA